VTINLNDDYDGGDLRFPEFGSRRYRGPVGAAVVFSCALLHEVTPMTRGVRYATLPFLYNDTITAQTAAELA
jgi:predicted 2-oxoglutarate/Fe(II)-dependent dioxygenase YbiX